MGTCSIEMAVGIRIQPVTVATKVKYGGLENTVVHVVRMGSSSWSFVPR